jgi:hypothetical protein
VGQNALWGLTDFTLCLRGNKMIGLKNILALCLAFAFIIAATILELKGHKPYDQVLLSFVFGLMAVLLK